MYLDDFIELRGTPNPLIGPTLGVQRDWYDYYWSFRWILLPFVSLVGAMLLINIIFMMQIVFRVVCGIKCCDRDFRVLPYQFQSIVLFDKLSYLLDTLVVCSSISMVLMTALLNGDRVNQALVGPWDYYLSANDSHFLGEANFAQQIDSFNALVGAQTTNIASLQGLLVNYAYDTSEFPGLVNQLLEYRGKQVLNPDPEKRKQLVTPSVVLALPDEKNLSSISGSLMAFYQRVIVQRNNDLIALGLLAEQAMNQINDQQEWTSKTSLNLKQSQQLRAQYNESAQHSLQMLSEPTIIGYYSLYSFAAMMGLFDILYFCWFRYRLMPKIWARRRIRQQSIKEKSGSSSSFKLVTKRSTINFIYFMFFSDALVLLACGAAFGVAVLSLFMAVDQCVLANQQNISWQCAGFSNIKQSLATNVGIAPFLTSMSLIGDKIDAINQQNYLNYPQLIKNWITVLEETVTNPSASPPPVYSFDNLVIQLGPSSSEVVDALAALNSWSDHSADESSQRKVATCSVLQDTIVFDERVCPLKLAVATSFIEHIGEQTCVPIQSQSFAQSRLNSAPTMECQRNGPESFYPSFVDQYVLRFSQLDEYQISLKNVVTPITGILSQLDALQLEYQTEFQQKALMISMHASPTLVKQSRYLLEMLECSSVQSTIEEERRFMCNDVVDDYFALSVGSLLHLLLIFLFVVASYFRTSRKVFVLKFSESKDNDTYEYSETQRVKHQTMNEL